MGRHCHLLRAWATAGGGGRGGGGGGGGRVPLVAGAVHGAGVGWPVVGGVFADAHVFHATVRDNITLGRDGITDDDVLAALRAARLDVALDVGLDGALDRVVGEDGAQLS